MRQALCAEFIGTAGLLTVVVNSGILGEQFADGNVVIALLANGLATGFGLYVLISVFRSVSGAHFNLSVGLGLKPFVDDCTRGCRRRMAG